MFLQDFLLPKIDMIC